MIHELLERTGKRPVLGRLTEIKLRQLLYESTSIFNIDEITPLLLLSLKGAKGPVIV